MSVEGRENERGGEGREEDKGNSEREGMAKESLSVFPYQLILFFFQITDIILLIIIATNFS